MILDEAIAELRRVMGDRRIEGQSVASGRLGLMHSEAIATILNAVLDGSLIRGAEARVGALMEAAQHQEQKYLFLHSAAYDVWKWFEVARPDLIGPRAEKLRDAVMGPRPYGCAALTTPAEETKG